MKAEKIGFEWWEPSRTRRIHEVLGGQTKHTVEDSKALQTDSFTMPALAAEADSCGAEIRRRRCRARHGVAQGMGLPIVGDSAAAALFELWWSTHLKPAFFAQVVPDPDLRALMMTPGDVESILSSLEIPARSRVGIGAQ